MSRFFFSQGEGRDVSQDSLLAFPAKDKKNIGPNYMATFSPGAERGPLKMKVGILWTGSQPGLKTYPCF